MKNIELEEVKRENIKNKTSKPIVGTRKARDQEIEKARRKKKIEKKKKKKKKKKEKKKKTGVETSLVSITEPLTQ